MNNKYIFFVILMLIFGCASAALKQELVVSVIINGRLTDGCLFLSDKKTIGFFNQNNIFVQEKDPFITVKHLIQKQYNLLTDLSLIQNMNEQIPNTIPEELPFHYFLKEDNKKAFKKDKEEIFRMDLEHNGESYSLKFIVNQSLPSEVIEGLLNNFQRAQNLLAAGKQEGIDSYYLKIVPIGIGIGIACLFVYMLYKFRK